MDDRLKNVNLVDEVRETFSDVHDQLVEDDKRWGDTWKERGLVHNEQSQEERWFRRMESYYQDFIEEGIPIPWTKVIGEAHICTVREKILK